MSVHRSLSLYIENILDLRSVLSLGGNANDGDDKLAGTHDSGTIDEELTATKLFHHVERGGGGRNIDNACDGRDQEGILDAHLQEERGPVVDLKFVNYRNISQSFSSNSQMKLIPVHCWNICKQVPMITR